MNDHRQQIDLSDWACVDPHFHTPASDGVSPVSVLYDKASRLGIKLGITDHNRIGGAVEAWEHHNGATWTYPGIELTLTERVHILVFFEEIETLVDLWENQLDDLAGLSATTPLKLDFDDFSQLMIEFPSALTVAPHPFAAAKNGMMSARKKYGYLKERIKDLEAIEVFNGQEMEAANEKAEALARKLRKPIFGGSDGHHVSEMGNVLTVHPKGTTFFEAIRNQQVNVLARHGEDPMNRMLGHSFKIPYHLGKGYKYLALGTRRLLSRKKKKKAKSS